MKKIFTFLSAIAISASIFSQTPQKMSYQAVIRNTDNTLVSSASVGMRISILQGSETGTVVFSQTIYPYTNANGLISIELSGLDTITWSNGPYYIKTETDPTGGTSYTITGTSQLLSVPFALHAKTAESVTLPVTETDPVFNVSVAKSITATDTTKWNNKLSSYSETQNLADVISINNSANAQIKNVTDPTDAQDAATKAYIDNRLSADQVIAFSPVNAYTNDAGISINKNSGYIEVNKDSFGPGKIFIPIDLPISIVGSNKKIKSVSVEYWNGASNCYISATILREFHLGSSSILLYDYNIMNELQTWTTYTVTNVTPASFTNHVELELDITYGNPPTMVIVQNIWVTLTN